MNPEDLMKPRYKVIADYPENTFGVGDVIDLDYEYDPEGGSYWYHECGFTKSDFDKYPHLFRKLEWWQERKPEELPQFIKGIGKDETIFYEKESFPTGTFKYRCHERGIYKLTTLGNSLPATLEEYTQYTNKQKQSWK